jgi:hypothetical protein
VRHIRVLTMVGVLVSTFMVAGCGSDSPAATTPTPTPAPAPAPTPAPTPTPTPAPTTATLTGTISNTSNLPVNGATVLALDGPNTGQTAVSNGNGTYLFNALTIANTNFSVNASGYLESRAGTFVNGTNQLNFVLTPVPPPPPPPPSLAITTRLISGGSGTPTQEWGFTATGPVFPSYDWDFGDGTSSIGSGANEQHVYRSRAVFTVTVIGKPTSGSNVSATTTIDTQ